MSDVTPDIERDDTFAHRMQTFGVLVTLGIAVGVCFQVGSGWPMLAWFVGFIGGSWFTNIEMRRQFGKRDAG